MLNDLEFIQIPKNSKIQLVDNYLNPKKTLKGLISAKISDYNINSSPTLSFELTNKIETSALDGFQYKINDSVEELENEMIVKVIWNNNQNENYFIIKEIKTVDSSNSTQTTVYTCEGILLSELKRRNTSLNIDGISITEAINTILKDTRWILGEVTHDFDSIYRSFKIEKQTVYESLMSVIKTYGAILLIDEKHRIINITTMNNIKQNRNVILKKENLLSEIEKTKQTNEIVTRLYITGNENMTIQNVNPTGMTYIEDFSYFIKPFKRDENKNVLKHSKYMSDNLCHALLDMSEKTESLSKNIKNTKENINMVLDNIATKEFELSEKKNEKIRVEALLDTAKATNDKSLINKNTNLLKAINNDVKTINTLLTQYNTQLKQYETQLSDYEKQIKTSYFNEDLQAELKSFIYEKTFKNDLYITEEELFDAGKKELTKYRDGITSFNLNLESFMKSLSMKRYDGRLQLGELVTIKSDKLNEYYKTLVVGYNSIDLLSGDINIHFADDIQNDFALDRLATLIYNSQTSTSILEGNKHRWDNIVKIENEVNQMRDADFDAINKRIVAGANESVTMDNRGLQIMNPDFPNERIIMQSGVMALSKDGGETWSTSVTPNGVIADTLIGKLIAGNDLIISNESGTLKINQDGMKVDMNSIEIINGTEGSAQNILDLWNSLLIDFEDLQNLNKVNPYEKNKLNEEWKQIKIIHSSLLDQYSKSHDKNKPHTLEYNKYIEAYESLNTFLNKTLQSDGFTILNQDRLNISSDVDGHILADKFRNYIARKSALENTIQIEITRSEFKVLSDGIFAKFVQKDEIVAQLNLTKDGVKIDGRLLSIDSKTEFNDDVKMNAGVIMSKDEKIQIDLNTGNISLNKPIHIGNNSNLSTKSDVNNQINQAQENFDEKINTVKNEFGQNLVTLENDLGEKVTLVKDEFGNTIKVIQGDIDKKITDAESTFDSKISETKNELGQTIVTLENDFGQQIVVVKNELGETVNVVRSDLTSKINSVKNKFDEKIETTKNELGQELTVLENDLGGKITVVKDEFGKTIKVIEGGLNDKISDAQQEFDEKISETKTDLGHTISVMENDFGKRVTVVKNELGETINIVQGDLTSKIKKAETTLNGKITNVESELNKKPSTSEVNQIAQENIENQTKDIYDTLEFLKDEQVKAQIDLSSRVAVEELNELERRYQEYYGATKNDIESTKSKLQQQAERVALISTDLGELAQEWKFTNKFMRFSDNGIVIGANDSNTQLTIENNQLTITSNGYEVMHINGGEIKISRGVFIETLKIGKYVETVYESNNNINIIKYIK